MSRNNIILTGPPRSGTTLSCHLLNQLPGTVALHEPMNLKMFPDRANGLKNIDQFFADMRASLLERGVALSKVKGDKIPDNPFENTSGGQRASNVQKGEVHFDKELGADFKLVIKQNAHFSFLLEELMEKYPCYSVVRNPLSTILSWNSITAPVSKGNLTVLKGIDPELHARLDAIPDLLDRMVFLADLLFQCYEVLPDERIIRYESIIDSDGAALCAIAGQDARPIESLDSRNRNKVYDEGLIEGLLERMQARRDAAWLRFYPLAELQRISGR